MENKFITYALSKEIMESLQILGYKRPTKIQEAVLPHALKSLDILAKSSTGSGKTAAFAIALCEQVVWEENDPQALVLEPTRELTVQVKEEIYQIGRKRRIKVPDLFGGFPIDKQMQTLRQKSHIVVGTPGRVLDHIRRGSLKLEQIKTVVIDEADLMLDMGFLPEVEEILAQIKATHNTMLFSATFGDKIKELSLKYLQEPVIIEIESEISDTREAIIEKIYEVEIEDKYEAFRQVLVAENPESAMIFCGTKEMVDVLCRRLRKDGIKAGMIHGDIDQQDRIRTINQFREGQFRYLIATDVIARGIDFSNLSHVLNYDFPTGRETYVHRIGRTGRNGASGTAISMVTPIDQRMRLQVEQLVGYALPVHPLLAPNEAQTKAFANRQKEKPKHREKKGAGFAKEITKLSIGGGKKSKIRAVDIVGAICNIEGIEAQDIGVIDVRESLTYVEIFHGKGGLVLEAFKDKPIKGKIRKVRVTQKGCL